MSCLYSAIKVQSLQGILVNASTTFTALLPVTSPPANKDIFFRHSTGRRVVELPGSERCLNLAMGRVFRKFLDSARVYTCSACDAHLADEEHVISKSFQGRLGRAFLFEKAVNIFRGPVENRVLISGIHKVADVRCTVCTTLLGWVYLEAKEDSQKYKEGRILLEKIRLTRKGNWF